MNRAKLVLWVFAIIAIMLPVNMRAASDSPTVTPEHALQQLLDGNERFVSNHAEHPGSRPSDAPQHPLAVILSCSDSRVPPEMIFDQGVGKLFVVRAAGNTYDQLGLESIRYAVEHLGVNLILVIGHDQCGAVTAAVKSYPDANAGVMLTNIYPAVKKTRDGSGDAVSHAIDENAILIAQRLATEPQFKPLVDGGKLRIQPARYSLGTGKVRLLEAK